MAYAVFVIAAGTLCLETALNRVFSVAQGYHFAFMTVSIALLGMGAGGTFLAVYPGAWRRSRADLLLYLGSLGFALSTVLSYVLFNVVPFDVYRIAWEGKQVLYLAIDYLALTLPFFCSGVVISLALTRADRDYRIYAANLIGSAAGALIAWEALSWLGGSGTVVLAAVMGGVVSVVQALRMRAVGRLWRTACLSLGVLTTLGMAVLVVMGPRWLEVRLSPYRPLSYVLQFPDAQVLSSRWNATSRVDVVASSAIHVSPGLSLRFTGRTPPQLGLYVDGNAHAPIVNALPAEIEEWSGHLPIALVYHLHPEATVLVLEPGGGLDLAVARAQGAARIEAVWSERLVADVASKHWKAVGSLPVEFSVRSPRAFVHTLTESDSAAPDIIVLALNDAQRAVLSGAYALHEDYEYTVEAMSEYMEALAPDGLLAIQRWLQVPPSESLRAWGLIVSALEERNWDPRQSLIAIRSWSTILILAKNGAFTRIELDTVRQFCRDQQFDLVYLPGLQRDEVNLYNVYEGAPYYESFGRILGSQLDRYDEYLYDVRPSTDERPYFHHFFRWRQVPQVWRSLGQTWQPFGGGGYLTLLALLLVATVAAGALILVPVAVRRSATSAICKNRLLLLLYFGLLGMGYMAVEIPLVQRLMLFLDHPMIAFVTVVAVLLISSGIGSLLTPWLPARWAAAILVGYLALMLLLLSTRADLLLERSLPVRIVLVGFLCAPLGLLMGLPFPAGLSVLRAKAPELVPWAWAINGCTSVITSILAALIALEWGFGGVHGLAGVVYLMAWAILLSLYREFARPGEA
jgi:hypothetical protein